MNQAPDGTGYWISWVIFVYLWCRADAKDRQVGLPLLASVLVPLLFPLGVPYYFLRTYPRRRAWLHIGMALLFAVACVAVARITAGIAFYYIIVVR